MRYCLVANGCTTRFQSLLGRKPASVADGIANGVSADGSVVVGQGVSASGGEAFRWTIGGGMVGLGDLPGGSFYSFAHGVSGDCSVVVGESRSASGLEAFRWMSNGGMVGLGDLPGGDFESDSEDISADGSLVVGYSASASGLEAFRWTSGGGMIGLGDLPGGTFNGDPWDSSADVSVIVGIGNSALGAEAFRWTSAGGMQNLRALLMAGGATGLTGWRLTQASALSADGRTIVGYGRNPAGNTEAWIATIPEPSSLLLLALTAATGVLRLRRPAAGVVGRVR
jgi:probable HAF family extracellular repeat protein